MSSLSFLLTADGSFRAFEYSRTPILRLSSEAFLRDLRDTIVSHNVQDIIALSRASELPGLQRERILLDGQGTICGPADIDGGSVDPSSVSTWGIVEEDGMFKWIARRTCDRQPGGKHDRSPD